MEGEKGVGAMFWLCILDGLKNRGVEGILIACVADLYDERDWRLQSPDSESDQIPNGIPIGWESPENTVSDDV